MNSWNSIFKRSILSIVIFAAITLVWQGYEHIVYGAAQGDYFDSFIAIALTMALTYIYEQQRLIKAYEQRNQKQIDTIERQNKQLKECNRVIKEARLLLEEVYRQFKPNKTTGGE